MTRRISMRTALLGALALALLPTAGLAQDPPTPPPGCTVGWLDGSQVLTCVPQTGWNGDLVVFAHGYVAPGEPVAIPYDQLEIDGTSLPAIVTGLGFAFATTSYRANGLAIEEGVEDVTALVRAFAAAAPHPPDHVYLVGASEGGLVTTLAVEQDRSPFSGGLATCGPVGDFRRQIDYLGDFRVLFDYFFPGVLRGDATLVPTYVLENWESVYLPRVTAALAKNPGRLDRLLKVSRAPFDPNVPQSKIDTALGILWYNVFATNDAREKLGGNPFDNSRRLYLGSGNDFWLNLLVKRYHADRPALAAIDAYYQTSGKLEAPLVTLHTTADPIVPYWHEPLYSAKALFNSGLLHTNLPVFRYGHCSFKAEEALVALGLLVLKVEGRELLNAERVLPTRQAKLRYRALAKANGLRR
jgi:alpha-beta hydrolase superfamily lysophospholipase